MAERRSQQYWNACAGAGAQAHTASFAWKKMKDVPLQEWKLAIRVCDDISD